MYCSTGVLRRLMPCAMLSQTMNALARWSSSPASPQCGLQSGTGYTAGASAWHVIASRAWIDVEAGNVLQLGNSIDAKRR